MSTTRFDSSAVPRPDAQSLGRSAEVVALIDRACRDAGGSIGFDRFMDLALYAPGIGYYNAPVARIGPGGDFTTAPERSPRFAACLARPVAQALRQLRGARVLEVGAGRGTLAAGVIDALDAAGVAFAQYCILERSASARAEQARTLGERAGRVAWLDDLPAPGFEGVVLANELLDAIAALRFAITGDGIAEQRVTVRDGICESVVAPFTDRGVVAGIERMLRGLAPLPKGYVSEFAPAREGWLASVAGRLARGLVLLVDYGYPRHEYYHPQRANGTLACHYRHRVHDDAMWMPGLQDISVHVDFTAIAERALASGLSLAGFTTQAHFLLETGLLDGIDDPEMDDRSRLAVAQVVRQLTLPGEMGEAMKFIAFTRGLDDAPAGFAGHDMSHRL